MAASEGGCKAHLGLFFKRLLTFTVAFNHGRNSEIRNMTKFALIFPGQGSQEIGMGKSLADAFPSARDVFAEVDEALGQDLSGLMWSGDIEDLTLTANTQPALMAHSVAAARALEAEFGLSAQDAAYVAGHSLGEYSALAAAGAIGLSDTARLLRIRGNAM